MARSKGFVASALLAVWFSAASARSGEEARLACDRYHALLRAARGALADGERESALRRLREARRELDRCSASLPPETDLAGTKRATRWG